MQQKNLDGSYGEPIPYDQVTMGKMLDDPEVEHVEVFNNTPDELSKRRLLFEQSQAKKRQKRKSKNRIQGKSRKNNR